MQTAIEVESKIKQIIVHIRNEPNFHDWNDPKVHANWVQWYGTLVGLQDKLYFYLHNKYSVEKWKEYKYYDLYLSLEPFKSSHKRSGIVWTSY